MSKPTNDPKIQLIRTVDLFRSCSEREYRHLAAAFDQLDLPAGRVLIHEGRYGGEAFVLVQGTAEVTIAGERIAMLGPGSVIGEMALVDRGPRTATVVLTTAATVLVTDPQRFTGVLAEMPSVSSKVLATLSRRLREAERVPDAALAQSAG